MIRKISRELILVKLAQAEKPVFLELSNLEAYDKAHIPFALHIDPERFEEQVRNYALDLGEDLILYGENEEAEALCYRVSERLAELGYGNLFVYVRGKEDWAINSLPLQTTGLPPKPTGALGNASLEPGSAYATYNPGEPKVKPLTPEHAARINEEQVRKPKSA